MYRATASLGLLTALVGCKGRVSIEYLKPARVTIAPQVQILAPVDRAAANLSAESLHGLVQQLASSPRFQLVDPEQARVAYSRQSSLVGAPLSQGAAEGICEFTGAQGIVTVEAVRAEPSWSDSSKQVENIRTEEYTEDGETRVREVREEYQLAVATLTLDYHSLWTTYDCLGRILDAHELASVQVAVGEGATPALARAAISDQGGLHFAAAEDVAQRYARRISPSHTQVNRSYYRGGSSSIRAGVQGLAAGDWERAREHWTLAADESQGKTRGKALYNLAVAAEALGELSTALERAEAADQLLDSGASAQYVADLQQRIAREKKLERQLGG